MESCALIYICPTQPSIAKAAMPGMKKMGEKVKTGMNFTNILRLSPIKALRVLETVVLTV